MNNISGKLTQQNSKSFSSPTQTPDIILEETLVTEKELNTTEIWSNYSEIEPGSYKCVICEKEHKKIKVTLIFYFKNKRLIHLIIY